MMGHNINFHTLQPVARGHSVRYVTMVRSPPAWALSLYLHWHPKIETQLDEKMVEFVQGLFTTCKAWTWLQREGAVVGLEPPALGE